MKTLQKELLLFSCPVVSDLLWPMDYSMPGFPIPHYLPEFAQGSCPLHQWWHPAISSSNALFAFCPQSFPASGTFLMSRMFTSVQFTSVTQSCPTLCNPTNHSMPGLPVHHQLPEFTQTHVHQVGDAIQPSHPLSSPSPPAPNPSQHQGFFQWVNFSHEVAKVLEFQLQH